MPEAALVKPRLRGVSHQWAFFVSVVLGAVLVPAAPAGSARVAAAIYAFSVAGLFGASALYHRINWATTGARRWMRRLDHSMIFVLIAGTYTPFAVLVLDGTLATVILVVVWSGAAALPGPDRPQRLGEVRALEQGLAAGVGGIGAGRAARVDLVLDEREVHDRGDRAREQQRQQPPQRTPDDHAPGRTKNAITAYWSAAAAITSAWKTSW